VINKGCRLEEWRESKKRFLLVKIGVFFGKIPNKTPLPQKMGLYFVHEKRHFVHENCQFVQMAQNRLEISVFDSYFDLKFKEKLVINNLKIFKS